MKIILKDGSVKEYDSAKSVYEIAADLSEGLARAACAGEVNGEVVDLRTLIDQDCNLNILTANDAEGLRVVRHTCSHVMAEAVKRIFPDAKLAIEKLLEWAEPQKTDKWMKCIREWETENPLEMRRNRGLTPQMIMEQINTSFKEEDAIIVTDVGQHQMWATQYIELNKK